MPDERQLRHISRQKVARNKDRRACARRTWILAMRCVCVCVCVQRAHWCRTRGFGFEPGDLGSRIQPHLVPLHAAARL